MGFEAGLRAPVRGEARGKPLHPHLLLRMSYRFHATHEIQPPDAFPTRKAGRQELISKFRLFCQENLKRELRPMEWDFRPSSMPLPKTHTGKIDKKLLEDTNA